jgi:hypothetical protein
MLHLRSFRRLVLLVPLVAVSAPAAFAGKGMKLETYLARITPLDEARREGHIDAELTECERLVQKEASGNDSIIFKLEQGTVFQFAAMAEAGRSGVSDTIPGKDYLTKGLSVFDSAEEQINAFEDKAKIVVSDQAGSLLTSQISLPYRGTAYDKIMLNTYKALAYLQLGDKDKARVELNRVLQRQNDALAENQRRIEAAQQEALKGRDGVQQGNKGQSSSYDVQKALEDPTTDRSLKEALANSDAVLAIRSYENYVNPFAFLVDGLHFTYQGTDGSDWEHGRKSWQRLVQIDPGNPYFAADLAAADNIAKSQPAPNGITYVIFATGSAPIREQAVLKIPISLPPKPVEYIDAPVPRLRFHPHFDRELRIAAADKTYTTALVASMDSVIALDFKNEMPAVVTKSILSTGLKAIGERYYDQASDNISSAAGAFGGFLKKGLTDLKSNFKKNTNIADDRCWSTLPKEFQYARFDTPADRTLVLQAGEKTRTITVAPGTVNVVLVDAVSIRAPLLVSQFALR